MPDQSPKSEISKSYWLDWAKKQNQAPFPWKASLAANDDTRLTLREQQIVVTLIDTITQSMGLIIGKTTS